MPPLKGTKTELNLKDAFAGESHANRRYLKFAAVFRSTAEGETRRSRGHLDYLE